MAAPELTVATQALAAGACRDSGNDRDLVAPSLAMRVNQSTVFARTRSCPHQESKGSPIRRCARSNFSERPRRAGLAIHDGGTAVQQFPPLRSPHFGVPFLDSQGKVRIPRIPTGPICVAQDCTFEIWIKTRLA